MWGGGGGRGGGTQGPPGQSPSRAAQGYRRPSPAQLQSRCQLFGYLSPFTAQAGAFLPTQAQPDTACHRASYALRRYDAPHIASYGAPSSLTLGRIPSTPEAAGLLSTFQSLADHGTLSRLCLRTGGSLPPFGGIQDFLPSRPRGAAVSAPGLPCLQPV